MNRLKRKRNERMNYWIKEKEGTDKRMIRWINIYEWMNEKEKIGKELMNEWITNKEKEKRINEWTD